MGTRADERAHGRLDDHDIHQLPVHELLQRQCPERTEWFVVQPERVRREQELERVEAEPEREDQGCVAEDKPVERKQVDERGCDGKQDLEQIM